MIDQIATYIYFPQIYHIWFSENIKKKKYQIASGHSTLYLFFYYWCYLFVTFAFFNPKIEAASEKNTFIPCGILSNPKKKKKKSLN